MEHLFFNGWEALVRIVIVGIASYVALILLLRISGKRTLSRMNAYDVVITMALGSILSKVLLTSDQSISESVTAMLVLITLQFVSSYLMYHFHSFRQFVSSPPAVLFHHGEFMYKTMRKELVLQEEIQSAIYARGILDNSIVEAVILGTNGDLSVLLKSDVVTASSVAIAAGCKQ